MCSFLLSLAIVGGVEGAPDRYMVQFLEGEIVRWVVVPTTEVVECLESPKNFDIIL
jgi:hypothetical protein